jgi:hypothetical protein
VPGKDVGVIDVAMAADPDVPALIRSFAACLAAVTETPLAEVPQPRADLAGALAYWLKWLAGRGTGLAPVARPARFNWPGYWIAVLREDPAAAGGQPGGAAVLMFGTPSGVVLSPQDAALVGSAATDLPVQEGFVLAALDPAFTARALPLPRLRGRVEAITLAEVAAGPAHLVGEARAIAGRGLDGDRYAAHAGTFTPRGGDPGGGAPRGYDLTLIEAEVLDALRLPEHRRLGYAAARRNLVTRGIDLNALVGRRFRVGEVECIGQRLCEPCAHLERLTVPGVLRGLIHHGGLRADVLTGGQIRTGTVIETID